MKELVSFHFGKKYRLQKYQLTVAPIRVWRTFPLRTALLIAGTLHAEAANRTVRRVSQEAGRTLAHRLMIERCADRIHAALGVLARLHAFARLAAQLVPTISILLASIRCSATGLRVRCTDRSVGALASIRAGRVLTVGARMARTGHLALINIRTTEWRADESVCALAFPRRTQLRLQTVDIAGAARLTRSLLVANLAGQTIVVRVAHLCAHMVRTAFANRTNAVLRARHVALVRNAHMPGGALRARRTSGRHTDAALIGRWISLEAGRTGALGQLPGELAHGIRSAYARRFAWILTAIVVAHLTRGAFAIAATARQTDAGRARLTNRTLAVRRAPCLTPMVHTFLVTAHTFSIQIAWLRALAVNTSASRRAVGALRAAGHNVTDASMCRIPAEARRTCLNAGIVQVVNYKRCRALTTSAARLTTLVRTAIPVRRTFG